MIPRGRPAYNSSEAMPDDPDISRYARQAILPGIGPDGQRRLLGSHAAIVGCGALGCTAADLLARAGVGTLTIVDRDIVESTNLQRQTLFDERDAAEGLPKAEAAKRRLAAVNSGVTVSARVADLTPRNAEVLLGLRTPSGGRAGVILDGTDNFQTRYLLNDLAIKHGVPYLYAGVVGSRGMSMPILPGSGPCLRCVFDEPPPPGSTPTCETAGVFAPIVSIISAAQASDAIKILLGRDDLVSRTLLDVDLWANQRRRVDLAAAVRQDCPCCGRREFSYLARDDDDTTPLCEHSIQVSPAIPASVDLAALGERLARVGRFTRTSFLLRGTLDGERSGAGVGRSASPPVQLTVFPDARAIFRNVTGPEHARSLYARYIGS